MTKNEKIHIVAGFIILVLLWHGIGARTSGFKDGYKSGIQDGYEKGRVESMCNQSNWYYNIGRILKNEAIKKEAMNNLKRCEEWGKLSGK